VAALPRVSLLPHRNDWSELERDAVAVMEHALAMRGLDRQGDVVQTPWTLSYVQRCLGRTKARRRGRDYARTVLATPVEMELLRDTGEVLKPRRQPSRLRSKWWRVFEVVPVVRARERTNPWKGIYPRTPEPSSRVTGSLCRFLGSQGLARKRRKPQKGSVQWVFAHSGPP
jgi:hypothetical protein